MEGVLKIEEECFPKSPYPEELFRSIHLSSDHKILVLEKEGEIIGDLCFDINGHLLTVAVKKKYRNLGLGSRLLHRAMDSIASNLIFLEVRESNIAAKAYYRKNGGKRIDTIKNYYRESYGSKGNTIFEDAEVWIITSDSKLEKGKTIEKKQKHC